MTKRMRLNGASSPIRVFVGTSASGEDAEAQSVLEYTLRKNTKRSVEITWMKLSRDSDSIYYCSPDLGGGWKTDRWLSPWTSFRWAVPAICGYQGKAIYMDCAQIIRGDIEELWNLEISSPAIVAVKGKGSYMQCGCLVWDCEKAVKWVPFIASLAADPGSHQLMLHRFMQHPELVTQLPNGWSVPDEEYSEDPSSATGSINCVTLAMQPHTRHSLARLRLIGREHWFKGVRLPHFCKGLVSIFDEEFKQAKIDYPVNNYTPVNMYGAYAIGGADRAQLGR